MSSMAYAERLARALESTGLAEPVKATHGEGRISILCRVTEGNEKKWIELVRQLLIAAQEDKNWQAHICRNYFLREDPDIGYKLVWGWNVSIHSLNLTIALDDVVSIVKGKPIKITGPAKEITEFPLVGASPTRNMPNASGKGVYTIGDREFHPARKS